MVGFIGWAFWMGIAVCGGLGTSDTVSWPFVLTAAERALDHVLTERLWRDVTYEEWSRRDGRSPREARPDLSQSLTFYHDHRLPPVPSPDRIDGKKTIGDVP
jgi:hypothetical protein